MTDDSRKLAIHVKKIHKINSVDYYDMLHPEKHKACSCGRPLKYIDIERGREEICGRCRWKSKMTGRRPWNAGLDKSTDTRVACVSEKLKKHYETADSWRLGRTKENCPAIAAGSQKISEKLKSFYQNNNHWSLGLTSESSEAIKKRSIKSGDSQRGKKVSLETRKKQSEAKKLTQEEAQRLFDDRGFVLTDAYVDSYTRVLLTCKTCNNECSKTWNAVKNGSKCPTCCPPWSSGVSAWQEEIAQYVESLGVEVMRNDREALGGLEIDILVPSANFGVECNGLYWHSVRAGKFAKQHVEKKRVCAAESGIDLLFLFEDEWKKKSNIVKSMIRHRLKKTETILDARKCTIEECRTTDVRTFINENHIDGYAMASYAMLLKDDGGNIVGACTLRWNKSNKVVLEIARLCFRIGVHVRGGVSRMIKKALEMGKTVQALKLMTYSDNRFGGKCYDQTRLKWIKNTEIRFWWTDFENRFDRFSTRADRSRGLTEADVAAEKGVHKIYGCSNSLFEGAIE